MCIFQDCGGLGRLTHGSRFMYRNVFMFVFMRVSDLLNMWLNNLCRIWFPELVNDKVNSCSNTIIDGASAVTDFNGSTCLSPFPPGREVFQLHFIVHLSRGLELLKVIIITNVSCHEPFTVLGIRRSSQCGSSGNDGMIHHQCMLLSETTQSDTYNNCLFACSCLGSCEELFLQQQFLIGQSDYPEEYRTCDIDITP